MRAGCPGLLLLAAVGCGSDDSGSGLAGSYRVVEQRADDTCSGQGLVVEVDPALEFFDLADADATIEWRPCASESECAGAADPVGDYPRRFDQQTANGWRAWLEASEDAGTVCNFFFYEISLRGEPTEFLPEQIALAEREHRETRTQDDCTRPSEVTVDTASCLEQRILLAIPR